MNNINNNPYNGMGITDIVLTLMSQTSCKVIILIVLF